MSLRPDVEPIYITNNQEYLVPTETISYPQLSTQRVIIPNVPSLANSSVEPIPIPAFTGTRNYLRNPIVNTVINPLTNPVINPLPTESIVIRARPVVTTGNSVIIPNREEEVMRTALRESMREYNDMENRLLEETIRSSKIAFEESQRAAVNINILKERQERERQDREYQESLRLDREKQENIRSAALAAEAANIAAEETTRKLSEIRAAEESRRLSELRAEERISLQIPSLRYPDKTLNDTYVIRFKLPTGMVITHSFHKLEPISSIIQQLKYDLKYPGDLSLSVQNNANVMCSPDSPINECGFTNRSVVFVEYS